MGKVTDATSKGRTSTVEDAACATVQLDGRQITVALSARQLLARSKGDLVTAEIIDVEEAPPLMAHG